MSIGFFLSNLEISHLIVNSATNVCNRCLNYHKTNGISGRKLLTKFVMKLITCKNQGSNTTVLTRMVVDQFYRLNL